MTKGELAVLKAELSYAKHRLLLLGIYQKNLNEQRDYYQERVELLELKLGKQEDLQPHGQEKLSAAHPPETG